MKSLKQLKEEILNNDIKNFYVFYGPDSGIKEHYINKLKTYCKNLIKLDNYILYNKVNSGGGLFKTKNLYLIIDDEEFLDRHSSFATMFKNRIKDDIVIFDYNNFPEKNNLIPDLENYVTYFPIVKDNIAYQFIDGEVNLSKAAKKELAKDCENNYSNILLETDKIKNYAEAEHITHEIAYQELTKQNQLIFKDEEFHSYEFMNDVLANNVENYSYWYSLIKRTFLENFWITLESISNDYMIAYYCKAFGSMKGSAKAYENKFHWGRAKTIREIKLPYEASVYLQKAELTSRLDAQVKFGEISHEKVLDYFFCIIL